MHWRSALWILMFFGRPFGDRLLSLLGVSPDMQLHRVMGGAQVFLVFPRRDRTGRNVADSQRAARMPPIAVIVTAIVLFPMIRERARYLANDATGVGKSLAAYQASQAMLVDAAIAVAQGSRRTSLCRPRGPWGGKFKHRRIRRFTHTSAWLAFQRCHSCSIRCR